MAFQKSCCRWIEQKGELTDTGRESNMWSSESGENPMVFSTLLNAKNPICILFLDPIITRKGMMKIWLKKYCRRFWEDLVLDMVKWLQKEKMRVFMKKHCWLWGEVWGVCWTLTKAHQQVHGIWIKMLHLLPSPVHTATGLAFLDLPLPQTNPRGKEKQD